MTAEITTVVYTVRVDRRLAGFSATSVQATPTGDRNNEKTNAKITVTPPTRGIPSSQPFSGSFALTCTDFEGRSYTSVDIPYNAHLNTIETSIFSSMSFLMDNVEVINDSRFAYRENGISFLLHFIGLDYEVPECSIAPSGDVPLTGEMDMAPNV